MLLHVYLTFNGNCREAMQFYQGCLGGELTVQTLGDTPLAPGLPEPMRGYVVHAMLRHGTLVLLGSDMVSDDGLAPGNAVSLLVQCHDEPEAHRLYDHLVAGGTPTQPLHTTFWGALFGGLTDRYGHHWLLYCEQPAGKVN